MTGARDETAKDSRDDVIRQQQIEISRLNAENEALRARMRGVGLDTSSPSGSGTHPCSPYGLGTGSSSATSAPAPGPSGTRWRPK